MGLKTTKDFGINSVTFLVYGPAGIEKTRMIRTAENPIIISHESGLMSLKDYTIPVWEVTCADELDEAEEYVLYSAEGKKYTTICVDSITDIAESLLADYKTLFKDPRQAYGMMNDTVSAFIRKFRDSGRNVYFTAHQKDIINDESDTVTSTPGMPGRALIADIPYFFDEVFVYRRIGKKKFLQTREDARYTAKDRSGTLLDREEPNIKQIMNKIRGGKLSSISTPDDILSGGNRSEKPATVASVSIAKKYAPKPKGV